MTALPEFNVPPNAALLLVDIQRGFCPGGNLAVAEGDRVVAVANAWIDRFEAAGRPIVLSRDWHPPDHVSFREQGGPWPPHCVAGTPDAAFHPDLRFPRLAIVVSKATEPEEEAYSAFDQTGLADFLRSLGVDHLYVMGLATDYCVRASVLDALREGFGVTLVREGVRAVNAEPGAGERALGEMAQAGATLA